MNDSNKCTPLGICRPGRRNGDLLAAQGPGALDPRRLRLCPPRGQHRCRGRRSGLLGQAHGGDHGQQAQQAQRADRRRHPRHRLPEDLRSRSPRGRVLSRCKRRRRPQLAVQGAAKGALEGAEGGVRRSRAHQRRTSFLFAYAIKNASTCRAKRISISATRHGAG